MLQRSSRIVELNFDCGFHLQIMKKKILVGHEIQGYSIKWIQNFLIKTEAIVKLSPNWTQSKTALLCPCHGEQRCPLKWLHSVITRHLLTEALGGFWQTSFMFGASTPSWDCSHSSSTKSTVVSASGISSLINSNWWVIGNVSLGASPLVRKQFSCHGNLWEIWKTVWMGYF